MGLAFYEGGVVQAAELPTQLAIHLRKLGMDAPLPASYTGPPVPVNPNSDLFPPAQKRKRQDSDSAKAAKMPLDRDNTAAAPRRVNIENPDTTPISSASARKSGSKTPAGRAAKKARVKHNLSRHEAGVVEQIEEMESTQPLPSFQSPQDGPACVSQSDIVALGTLSVQLDNQDSVFKQPLENPVTYAPNFQLYSTSSSTMDTIQTSIQLAANRILEDHPSFWFWTWDMQKVMVPHTYAFFWSRLDVLAQYTLDVQIGFWNLAVREHILPPQEFCNNMLGCTLAEFVNACFAEKPVGRTEPDGPWNLPSGTFELPMTPEQLAQPNINFQAYSCIPIHPVEAKFFETRPMVLYYTDDDLPISYLAYAKRRKDFPKGVFRGPFTRAIEYVLDHPEWQRVYLRDLDWFVTYKGLAGGKVLWHKSCEEVNQASHSRFLTNLFWFSERSMQLVDWPLPNIEAPYPNRWAGPRPHEAMFARPQPADQLYRSGV